MLIGGYMEYVLKHFWSCFRIYFEKSKCSNRTFIFNLWDSYYQVQSNRFPKVSNHLLLQISSWKRGQLELSVPAM